jgi:hypothetical protein
MRMECSMTRISCPNSSQNTGLVLHALMKLIFNLPRNGAYRPTQCNISNIKHRTSHGGRAVVEKSTIHHNKANLPQLTSLEVTAVNTPTWTETLYTHHPAGYFLPKISRHWPSTTNTAYLLVTIKLSIRCVTLVWQTPGAEYCTVMLSNTTTKSEVHILLLTSRQTIILGRTSST